MNKYLPRYKSVLMFCVFLATVWCAQTSGRTKLSDPESKNNIGEKTEIRNKIRSKEDLSTEHAKKLIQNPCSVTLVSKKIWQLSNSSRKKARKCNGEQFPSAPKLHYDCSLSEMAKKHALELHERATLSHRSADGASLTDRANKLGIQWQALAENIADDYQDPTDVHNDWLKSGPHCKNIMNSTYNSIGVAEREGIWVVVFAKK